MTEIMTEQLNEQNVSIKSFTDEAGRLFMSFIMTSLVDMLHHI